MTGFLGGEGTHVVHRGNRTPGQEHTIELCLGLKTHLHKYIKKASVHLTQRLGHKHPTTRPIQTWHPIQPSVSTPVCPRALRKWLRKVTLFCSTQTLMMSPPPCQHSRRTGSRFNQPQTSFIFCHRTARSEFCAQKPMEHGCDRWMEHLKTKYNPGTVEGLDDGPSCHKTSLFAPTDSVYFFQ